MVIGYHELSKQLPKVQTAHAKSQGSILLIATAQIDHIWAKLKGAKYFSSLDIRSGYHHISMHPESRPKTAFICPYGKFQWKRVIYGIAHAHSLFLIWQCFKLLFKYLDEQSRITSPICGKIFEKFHYASLKLKPSKHDFFKLHIEYLGHLICGTGIYPLRRKVQAILDLVPPSNVTQVRHILGLATYYRKFIPMFSSIVSPITSFTKRAACQNALDAIKHTITNSPVFIYPDPDKQSTCSLMHQIIHDQVY